LFFLHKELARSVLDEAVSLDRDRGLKLLFDSFREHHQRYPQKIIHSLDEVVRFAEQFPKTDFVKLYEVWSAYNRNLAAGLSPKPVDVSYLHNPLPSTFLEACLNYLVRMFDYPDVDVRLLSADACLDLLNDDTTTPTSLLKLWPELNATQKEHLMSLLFSYALKRPDMAEKWVPELLDLAAKEVHFSIRRTVSELVFAVEDTGAVLSPMLREQVRALRVRRSTTASQPRSAG
jgi:hypothetical protein